MFVGEYDRSVDGNGRLALPSMFRDLLGERCYATRDPLGCISLTPKAAFDSDAEKLMARVDEGELPESSVRAFAISSSIVSIDKQGRITLDEDARYHAGIRSSSQVFIAGNLKNLQIWRPSRYRQMRSEDEVARQPRVWLDEDDA